MFSRKKNEIEREEIKQLLVFSATRYQQDFYELLSDWNEYDLQQPHILKNCIGTVLFGPPKAEENEDLISVESRFKYNKSSQMRKIDRLYDKIVEHGTQSTNDKKIFCGLIYNIIFNDKSIKAVFNSIHNEENFNGDCLMKYVSPVPLFKVLKSTLITNNEKTEEPSSHLKLEIYYIDDNERVYKSWNNYLTNNVLPPCVMVVPYGGEYQGDESEQWTEEMSFVRVDVHDSPAYRKQILRTLDTSSTVLSMGGMAVCAASLFTPVAPIALAVGGIGLGVSSLWTVGRSSQTLIDRSKHEQSINITNIEGFTCWFSIATSALAVASTGGSILLTRAIKNGTSISRTFQLIHDGVQITTVTASGVTAGLSVYNIYDTYKESQTVSKQEVLNLMASLLVLGNSVVKFQFSATIIENHQNAIIKNYESSLRSNRHRKAFKKMISNTKSVVENPTQVKEQIIRGINKIGNKDEFFASIVRNKKSFAVEGIKPAFVDGKFVIDGKTLMNPVDFVKSMSNTSASENIIIVNPVASSSSVTVPNKSIFENALTNFITRHTKELAAIVIPKITDFFYVLTDIDKLDNADVVFSKLLTLALKIAKVLVQENYSVSDILARAVDFLWAYIKASIRQTLNDLIGPEYRKMVMKVLIHLYSSVDEQLEEWVASFKEYLRIKVVQIEESVKDLCSSGFESINIASRSLLSDGVIS